MITRTPPAVLDAFCYAMPCRQRREWRLILRSAPVYGCSGSCGTTREIRELGFLKVADIDVSLGWRPFYGAVMTKKEERGSKISRRRRQMHERPFCNCCKLECAIVLGSPVLRCKCDPHGMTCPHCSRGLCHCRCPKRPIVLFLKLQQSQEI